MSVLTEPEKEVKDAIRSFGEKASAPNQGVHLVYVVLKVSGGTALELGDIKAIIENLEIKGEIYRLVGGDYFIAT